METDNSMEIFRNKIHQKFQDERNTKRNNENDSYRLGLGEIKNLVEELENLTEKDVHGLCVRIKRRKHATPEDLFRLSQAFLHSKENITSFAKTPGALPIVVKELTGHNSEQQIRAVETLCNLSLGDEIVCEKIVQQAGSYLVTFLDSIESRLKQTTLWTLINIVSTGGKGFESLLKMGILKKFIDIYYSNNTQENTEYEKGIAIFFNEVFKHKTFEKLRLQNLDVTGFFDQISNIPYESSKHEYLTEIIFNSCIVNSGYSFKEDQLEYISNKIIKNTQSIVDFMSPDSIREILYDIRLLANLVSIYKNYFISIFERNCSFNNTNLIAFINQLFCFQSESFKIEVLWLLKNLLCLMDDDSKRKTFLNEIQIPSNN